MVDNNQSNSSNQQYNQTNENQNNQERPSFKAYGTYTPKQPESPPANGSSDQQVIKHSGLGITSFIFSIFSLLLIVISLVFLFVNIARLAESDLNLLSDPAYVEEMIASGEFVAAGFVGIIVSVFALLSVGFFSLLGLIFGIISLFIKNRKKVFGIIGTIINGLLFLGGFFFFLISILSAFAA